MFNLAQAIAEWRRQMAARGIESTEVLDELESHLRDDVEQRLKSGMDAPEAFASAARNLGCAGALRDEFNKLGPVSTVLEKLMLGLCLLLVASILLLSAFTIFVCYSTWEDRLMASFAVICILLVACGWRHAVPLLPVIANRRKRWTLGGLCLASGFGASALYCGFILPYFEVSPERQLPAAGFWAVFLIAIFVCPGVGLMMSAEEREYWGMNKSGLKRREPTAS